MVTEHPWEGLPPEVADVLRPELPALADEIVAELSRGVPDYARPLEGPFGQALRAGVEEALGRFTLFVADPKADPDAGREVYLTSAAARCAPAGASTPCWPHTGSARGWPGGGWPRRASEPASRRAPSTRSPRRSSPTSTSSRPTRSRATRASRRRLPAHSSAAASGSPRCWCRTRRPRPRRWRPRRRTRACGCRAASPCWWWSRTRAARGRSGWRSGSGRMRSWRTSLRSTWRWCPRPRGRRSSRRRCAAGGPRSGRRCRWQEAALSFARAREVLRLAGEGGIDGDEALLVAERHKLSLLLGADRRLARDVAESALAPLESETELSRERLGSTLDAWLRHRGRTEAVAKALHVHPQTVRYRLARLRELFGSRLDDPDGRFELELALRARRIAG